MCNLSFWFHEHVHNYFQQIIIWPFVWRIGMKLEWIIFNHFQVCIFNFCFVISFFLRHLPFCLHTLRKWKTQATKKLHCDFLPFASSSFHLVILSSVTWTKYLYFMHIGHLVVLSSTRNYKETKNIVLFFHPPIHLLLAKKPKNIL